jgi:hypothetical protein
MPTPAIYRPTRAPRRHVLKNEPRVTAICHCTHCQKLGGIEHGTSPFIDFRHECDVIKSLVR